MPTCWARRGKGRRPYRYTHNQTQLVYEHMVLVPKMSGTFFGGFYFMIGIINILGSVLGSPYSGKLPTPEWI